MRFTGPVRQQTRDAAFLPDEILHAQTAGKVDIGTVWTGISQGLDKVFDSLDPAQQKAMMAKVSSYCPPGWETNADGSTRTGDRHMSDGARQARSMTDHIEGMNARNAEFWAKRLA
jgi:hypothetical protein